MELSNSRSFVMNLLKNFRCLRKKQIAALFRLAFGCSEASAQKYLFRLYNEQHHLLSRPRPELVAMKGALPNEDVIRSMDVMLAFRNQKIVAYRPGAPPFKLVFVKESDRGFLRAYYVTTVHRGAEFLISEQARGAVKGHGNVVIFLLDSMDQADEIHFPDKHYYAVPGKYGHRFYEGSDDS